MCRKTAIGLAMDSIIFLYPRNKPGAGAGIHWKPWQMRIGCTLTAVAKAAQSQNEKEPNNTPTAVAMISGDTLRG